jgi:hypothetical protein
MRASILSLVGGLIACCLATQAVAQTNDGAQAEVFIKVANAGDCTGYPAMADLALSDRLDRFHGARLAVATAICAARDGRFDLTDRLIVQASLAPLSGTEVQVRFAFYYLIERLTDIPGAGASAARAAKAMTGLDPFPDRTLGSAEIGVMATFAAGHEIEGLDRLTQIDRREALSIQTDRRFAPAWLGPLQLTGAIDRPLKSPAPPLGESWTRELANLSRESDEAAVLSAARRFMRADVEDTQPFGLAFGKTGTGGDGQRAWLVRRLLEDGRIDEAREILDAEAVGEAGKSGDMLFVPGLTGVIEGLIRSDRPDEANRLLDWWNVAQRRDKTEYVGYSRDDDVTLWPLRALQACLKGDHAARLDPIDWRVSLTCNDPEDRTAALLIQALGGPGRRNEMLQAINLPPIHPPLGKADEDYRRRWNALLARSDVSAAIERYGRRLPPETAWRLSRAYPAF